MLVHWTLMYIYRVVLLYVHATSDDQGQGTMLGHVHSMHFSLPCGTCSK